LFPGGGFGVILGMCLFLGDGQIKTGELETIWCFEVEDFLHAVGIALPGLVFLNCHFIIIREIIVVHGVMDVEPLIKPREAVFEESCENSLILQDGNAFRSFGVMLRKKHRDSRSCVLREFLDFVR
jgi:hypothetical protein